MQDQETVQQLANEILNEEVDGAVLVVAPGGHTAIFANGVDATSMIGHLTIASHQLSQQIVESVSHTQYDDEGEVIG